MSARAVAFHLTALERRGGHRHGVPRASQRPPRKTSENGVQSWPPSRRSPLRISAARTAARRSHTDVKRSSAAQNAATRRGVEPLASNRYNFAKRRSACTAASSTSRRTGCARRSVVDLATWRLCGSTERKQSKKQLSEPASRSGEAAHAGTCIGQGSSGVNTNGLIRCSCLSATDGRARNAARQHRKSCAERSYWTRPSLITSFRYRLVERIAQTTANACAVHATSRNRTDSMPRQRADGRGAAKSGAIAPLSARELKFL